MRWSDGSKRSPRLACEQLGAGGKAPYVGCTLPGACWRWFPLILSRGCCIFGLILWENPLNLWCFVLLSGLVEQRRRSLLGERITRRVVSGSHLAPSVQYVAPRPEPGSVSLVGNREPPNLPLVLSAEPPGPKLKQSGRDGSALKPDVWFNQVLRRFDLTGLLLNGPRLLLGRSLWRSCCLCWKRQQLID